MLIFAPVWHTQFKLNRGIHEAGRKRRVVRVELMTVILGKRVSTPASLVYPPAFWYGMDTSYRNITAVRA